MFKATTSRKWVYSFLVITFMLFISYKFVRNSFAQTQGRIPTPPQFPKCEDKLAVGRGDWSRTDSGTFTIPGKGVLNGRRDRYTLPEGNFLECIVEENGAGTQVDWWNLQGLPLGRVDIDAYARDGWVSITSGSDWGLQNAPYLAKSNSFTASEISVNTPTPTGSKTITPTDTNSASSCKNVTLNKTKGSAPLDIQLTITGSDPSGEIKEYEFDTGDTIDGEEKVVKQTTSGRDNASAFQYTYETPGTYKITAWIKDSQDNWKTSPACKKTIIVTTQSGVGGASNPDELPETGIPVATFFALMIIGEVGYIFYKKFQLV